MLCFFKKLSIVVFLVSPLVRSGYVFHDVRLNLQRQMQPFDKMLQICNATNKSRTTVDVLTKLCRQQQLGLVQDEEGGWQKKNKMNEADLRKHKSNVYSACLRELTAFGFTDDNTDFAASALVQLASTALSLRNKMRFMQKYRRELRNDKDDKGTAYVYAGLCSNDSPEWYEDCWPMNNERYDVDCAYWTDLLSRTNEEVAARQTAIKDAYYESTEMINGKTISQHVFPERRERDVLNANAEEFIPEQFADPTKLYLRACVTYDKHALQQSRRILHVTHDAKTPLVSVDSCRTVVRAEPSSRTRWSATPLDNAQVDLDPVPKKVQEKPHSDRVPFSTEELFDEDEDEDTTPPALKRSKTGDE